MPPAEPPRDTAPGVSPGGASRAAVPPDGTPQTGPHPAGPPRQAIIRHIAVSIGELGKHLATQKDVAAAITATTAQAQAIAFKAWQVLVGGPDAPHAARELAADLDRFAADLAAMSTRAGLEAILSSEAASILMMAASEFAAVADDPQAIADPAALRARLRPLAAQLETIPTRLREGKLIAQAFAEGARSAVTLAARGKRLAAAQPGQVAQDVYDAMSTLAGETTKLSEQLLASAARGQQVAAMMATRVQDLAKPASAWAKPTNRSELSSVIDRGAARVW
ncbi:MAG: hypothetical protein P4L71_18550 [Acetobacteraceae bacterium]|nr:hypothetical protein [Acetobacteraceae bacterium]